MIMIEQTKVVRFFDNLEKNIQFDYNAQPLFSTTRSIKFITENRNRDICVADYGANAVIVLNQNGELRFRYHPFTSKPLWNHVA